MEGWIKIDRCLLNWEWFDDSKMVHLFIYLLLNANVEDKEWHGIVVKRGQLVTSLESIKKGTFISIQSIRTCLEKLCKTGEIVEKSTNKYRLITICKYDKYQDNTNNTNNQLTINQQSTNNQLTTTKEDNKNIINNINNNLNNNKKETSPKGEAKKSISLTLEKDKHKFIEELKPYVEIYGRDMMNEFFLYWTEPNKSKTKMRFQMERTWDTKRRLKTWSEKPFNSNMKQKSNSNSRQNGAEGIQEDDDRFNHLDLPEDFEPAW